MGGDILDRQKVGGGSGRYSELGGDFDGVVGAVENLNDTSSASLNGADGFAILNDRDIYRFDQGGTALGTERSDFRRG